MFCILDFICQLLQLYYVSVHCVIVLCIFLVAARGLRHGSAAVRSLGLRVRIPPGAWMSVLVSVACYPIDPSATGWSFVQRSPTGWGLSECDRENSIMRRLWPTGGCWAMERKITLCYIKTKQTNKQVLLMPCCTIHNNHLTWLFTLSYITHCRLFKFISF